MTDKEEMSQTLFRNLLNETREYLDDLQSVPWDVNLGIAFLIYDPSNFGLVTNSIPTIEPLTDQFMTNWSRYRQCETSSSVSQAYDNYLDDEDGEDFDFDKMVYESMLKTLRELKSSYNLESDIYAADFFWAIQFADPTPAQEEIATNVFRELNSSELFSQFKEISM